MLHQLAASNSLGILQKTFQRRNWITHSNNIYLTGALERLGGGSVFYGQKYPDSLLSEYHGMLVKEFAFVPADTSTFQPLVFETDPTNKGKS